MNGLLSDVSGNMGTWGKDTLDAQSSALKELWLVTFREAQTQTFSDTYVVIMVCFIITTALVPLMRIIAPPKGPSPDAH